MNSDIPLPSTLFFSFVITVFLASCGKTPYQSATNTQKLSQNLHHLTYAALQHAKQCDIPVPVGFNPVATKKNEDEALQRSKTMLCYQGNLSVDQIIDFYKQAMEINGWRIQDFSTSEEGLLFCNKARKQCALSIRRYKKSSRTSQTKVTIILCNSKYYAIHKPRDIDIINKKEINLS